MGLMTKQFMSRLVYDHSRSVRQVDFMASWGTNIDCSLWAGREATSAFAGLQILVGNVHLTCRIPESWPCAADTLKSVRMLYKMHLFEKGTRVPAPQGNAAAALAASLLSLPGAVSQCGWYPHQTCLEGAVLAFGWMVKEGWKWTHFLLGCSEMSDTGPGSMCWSVCLRASEQRGFGISCYLCASEHKSEC